MADHEFFPEPMMLVNDKMPVIGVQGKVFAECGCSAFVGKRLDTLEAAVAAFPHDEEHIGFIKHFYMLMKLSTNEPQDKLLIEVVEDIMAETERNYVAE